MRRGRRFLLPVPLIREILQLVARYRSLYVAKEGEYKLWFEETLTDILPTVQKQFRNDRKGEVEKLMRHITGTYNQAHQIENSVQIGIAGSPQLLTVARLRNLVNTNGACTWEFQSMGGITQMALDPARTARLLAFILDAIRRHMQIVHNGMVGAPDDWNRLLRFIRRTNDMIAASFVPRPPPDPRPANWNDPEPPTSPILPLYSTTPKHIDIAGDQCIGELLKRWKRLFPQRYSDFEITFFHGNFVNQRTSPHLREAWPRLFKINDLISDGDKSKYKNVPRSFAFSIASDSVAVSVKFEKAVPKVVYDASQVRAVDGMSDEDEDVARRARAAEANRKMIVDALKEAEVLYQRRDAGEIEVREIGADPGISAILTCAERTSGVHADGTPEYSFFSISPKRWMSEIGVTQRNANRNWQASQDLPTQQPPGDPTSLYDPAGRSMADIYNGIGSKRQTDYQRVRERAEYRLEHLDEMVEFEWKFARHKLENYRGAQIGVIRMVDELLAMKVSGTPKLALTRTQRKNRKRKEQRKRKERRERMADEHGPGPPKKPVHVIISLGSTKTGSMKYIKGHMRASLRRFVNEFERRDNVLPILVNEFRTSKTHHKCGTVMLDTRGCLDNRSQRKRRRQPTPFHPPMSIPTFKPWGERWCYHGPCNLACVGRDQNAAINMLRIFEHAMARWLQNHTYDPNDRPAGLERP
ncbi:hypothetical protein DFJ74DRAFT_225113 [Hyaloraphidium curvatum]|nr:hypothetical protein DFJ74DRAFT_225113 [Hyaloraphidium curvatum]